MNNKIPSINLGNRIVKKNSMPYVIAEIGVNHEGSIDLAKELIYLAKKGGAHAAKFQSYKANTLASKNSPAYWDTKKEPTLSQHELFQKFDKFDKNDYHLLSDYCNEIGIDFLSTPFDDEAIDYLAPLVPFFKVASADITNVPFLRKIGHKNKPVVLSTGASNIDEIELAVNTLKKSGCNQIALLHCILNYPTSFDNANLLMIKNLADSFPELIIGYSDHTLPDNIMSSLIAAHLLGAVIIEKHFTHNKLLDGNDHYHAMDVNDLKKFTKSIKKIHKSLGNENIKKAIHSEKISRLNARRSIVLKHDLPKGKSLSEIDLTYKRPGTGISPTHWDEVIGKKLNKNLEADSVLLWEFLD